MKIHGWNVVLALVMALAWASIAIADDGKTDRGDCEDTLWSCSVSCGWVGKPLPPAEDFTRARAYRQLIESAKKYGGDCVEKVMDPFYVECTQLVK